MENFEYRNMTKIIFGKNTELGVGAETKKYTDRVLLHYGGGSVKKTGLLNRIIKSLNTAGVEFYELGGVKPNPRLSLVQEGISICRKENIKFVLAIGGGSVIDSAKAISVGVPYDGDVWDFYDNKRNPEKALPVATVLTIPAAGSESSPSSVITNEDGWFKRGLTTELIRPVFSVLNPELTYTLSVYQTACGLADIMAHAMERYFTITKHVDFTDRLCEAVMKTIIINAPLVLKDPENYDARAEVMWAGTIAHCDLLNTGRTGDWSSHMIEHEISGLFDVAHGAGLAVVFPAWMKYVYKHDVARFAQFAARVWNIETDFYDLDCIAVKGIVQLKKFFKSIGLPVTLRELDILGDKIDEMADKCTLGGTIKVGGFVELDKEAIVNILKLAV